MDVSKPSRRGVVWGPRAEIAVVEAVEKRLGSLPVIAGFCRRIDIAGIIDQACPIRDLAYATHGQVVEVLIANRLTSPAAMVRIADWARSWAVPEVFGVSAGILGDDRLGRALDAVAEQSERIIGSVGAAAISPTDFNTQLDHWLASTANTRTVRSIQGRPVDLLQTDYLSMMDLPPIGPQPVLQQRIRLGRDYYVRVDTVDYSVDPRSIGRFVEVTATAHAVTVSCDGTVVARHERSWAKHGVITDPGHAATAKLMRHALADDRQRRQAATRHHGDGHPVTLRALHDYDALFGVDFNPTAEASSE